LHREALAPPELEDPEEAFIRAAVAMGFGEEGPSPRAKQQGGGGTGGTGDVFWPIQMASIRPWP